MSSTHLIHKNWHYLFSCLFCQAAKPSAWRQPVFFLYVFFFIFPSVRLLSCLLSTSLFWTISTEQYKVFSLWFIASGLRVSIIDWKACMYTHTYISPSPGSWHVKLVFAFNFRVPHGVGRMLESREYWMFHRGPGFLAVVRVGCSHAPYPPLPPGKLSLFLGLPTYRR